mmetsp:Transcript_2021/g.5983  ORF Transcript_2021/g.5983 Transcript_2021/m.5983 type:complete len:230 (+) Transcript_2021:130-819(+)|eukprot:CAMPEP_0117648428 /NCGR_PEP_ID=MMETSP0804-20121206/396_1 /TAXON_ID=1074897 /ORGANISM="Tetraselmis astigmatica, Strain CCMP880" /LENGTH=229 /DNA_ID=CAMNT_0005454023 /DNA_START=122 /DNA_END=811 /DNA_ORIENTATION=+
MASTAKDSSRREPATRTWACKCGGVKITLRGEPVMSLNCNCRSCTAVTDHLDSRPDPGTSALAKAPGSGVAKTFFLLSQLVFEDPTHSKIGFLKLGDTGENVRTYTTCCGTMLNTSGGNSFPCSFRPFNRNCIVNSDGTPYQPPYVVPNVNTRAALQPATVAKPSFYGCPTWALFVFVSNMFWTWLTGYGLGGLGKDAAMWKKGSDSDVEVVSPSWEGSQPEAAAGPRA